MTVLEFTTALTEVEALAQSALKTVSAIDPELEAPIVLTADVLALVSSLVTTALTAWSAANDQPITVDTVQALLPNVTPLTPPDEV